MSQIDDFLNGKAAQPQQKSDIDAFLDSAPEPGFAARLKQGASRALDSASTALTDDPDKIAKIAAEQARTALPQTETQRKMAEEIAPYSDAAAKAEGVVDNVKSWGTLGFKRAGQLISNPAEAGKMIAEQLPNSLPGLAGGFAGAKAGAALGTAVAPGVGTVIGGIAGGLAGGFAGGYGLEKGASVQEQVQQQAQERGIDVRNEAEVSKMLQQSYPEIEAAAQRKGVGTAGTDAALNVATMGLAGLGGRTLAKEARTLAEGVKSGSISAADAATDLARLEAASAARNTLKAQALRGTGVVGAEMAGEGISEAVGQKFAYGEVNPGEVVDEALLGLGSGGAMALGSKAFNKAAGVVDQDATARDLAQVRDALGEPSQPSEVPQDTAQPQPDMSPPLALPAPVIDVAQDGTARTAADRNSRLSRIADGDVTDVTPVPSADAARESGSGAEVDIQAPAEVEAPRSVAMGLDPAHGPLTAGAALAVDTGVTDQMQQAAALTQAAELAKKTGAAPQEQKQPAAKQALSPEEEAGLASTLAGSDLVNGSIESSAASELQAKLNEVQQRAAENGSWNVPLMVQRKRIEDAMAKLQATAVPQNQTSPQGVTDGPQADQAQQDRAQPAQVGATSAVAGAAPDVQGSAGAQGAVATTGVADGSPSTANPGAQGTAAPGAQAQAQSGKTEALRQQLRDVEAKILKASPEAMGQGGGDIEAAMKIRKVPVTLKAKRQKLVEQVRASQEAEVQAFAPETGTLGTPKGGEEAKKQSAKEYLAEVAAANERAKESAKHAPREIIEPAKDTPAGVNANGDKLYDREDGTRYAMRHGRPDFGGDLAPAGATHADPGQAPEPATPAVVAQSVQKAARNEDVKPSAMRAWVLAEIDKAMLDAPEKDATEFVSFDVPGDGTFKVQKSRERLQAFRKQVQASPGFKDGGQKPNTQPPEQTDTVRNGSGSTVEAIRNFLSDGDIQGAVEFAKLKGVEFTPVAPQFVLSPKGKAKSKPASVASSVPSVAEGLTQLESESIYQWLQAEQDAEKSGQADAQPPQDFIPAPDGGLDYGEITPEMGKAMRRQAGKIRLQQGDDRFGLTHIEKRHGDEIRNAGFSSVQEFVADIAKNIDQVWKPDATSQLVALHMVKNDRVMFVRLQADSAGGQDFYTVNTAFPSRAGYVANKKNWEMLWDGRAQPSQPATSEQAPFAASPPKAGEATTIPSGQSEVSVPPTAPEAQPITRADVTAAQQQARDMIAQAIDAMSAGELNKIAKRFLPTMGLKPTISKERNKAAMLDQQVNLQAAADELGAILPADVKRALQADMEGRVADAGQDDGVTPRPAVAKQEPGKPIEDAGEKIGGARKDRWKERGLNLDDLDAMTEAEGAELATKANVWKPDYDALAEASEPVTAAMVKTIYDQLAAKPKKNTPEGRRQYVQMMRIVRDVLTEADGPEAVKNAYQEIRKRAGLNTLDPKVKADGRELLFSVYKGRSDPFVFGFNELQRAKKLVEDGFPAKAAPWKSRLSVGRREGGNGTTERGIEMYMELSAEVGTPLTREQILGGFYRVSTKDNKAVAFAASKADAEAAAATVYERDMKGKKDSKPEPVRPNLDELKRENLPQRIDRDVTSEDFVRDLGFRGVEFGNWSAQDERQRILNMAYDGLMDLAEIMGVPPKAMSLNGTLGMAFGARGGGRFAAHYEPGKLVINMTKIRGGGSMAHEWAHAMDHYFGELDKPDAYTTQARGASGWYSEDQYLGVPRKRMERVGNEWKNVEKMRLDNLRPEMAAAFDEVMRGLFKKQITKAEMVRSLELDLERTEALARSEQVADLKAMYQNMVQNKRQALDELRGDPEGTMYAGRGRTDYANQAQALSGKSVDGYWVRPTEMFARAFESWVFDRVTAMGAKSDYLVHGVEEDRFAGGAYKGNPYPTGDERARINAAFDKLAQTIKTKETDKGVAMFSSADAALPAKPLSLDRVNQLVQEALSGIRGAPPVKVTARPADIGLKVPAGSVGYGVTLRSGDIYVFQSAMGSDLDVFKTVFHELFHRGVRVLVPKAQYVQTMLDLAKGDSRIQQLAIEWKNTEMGQKQKDNLRQQGYTGAELTGQYEALAIEEALAAVAEEIKAQGKLGSKPKNMTIRFLANWLAKLADMAGMKKLAQGIRAMTYNEAERFVMSAIDRSGEPVLRAGVANLRSEDAPAGDQTQTDAFKRWFGDSKVVDADGKPMRVYHGTTARADFTAFNKGPNFFTSEPAYANNFNNIEGGRTLPVYLSLKTPLDARELGSKPVSTGEVISFLARNNIKLAADFEQSLRQDTGKDEWWYHFRTGSDIQKAIQAAGYDGMIQRESAGSQSTDAYVAFSPEQIKSATGNRGTFDPENADIRFRSADMGSRAGMASKARDELANAAGAAIKSVTATNIKQRAGFKLTDYLGLGLQALGRRQIVDIYGDLVPLAEYNRLVQQMEADKNEGGAEADKLVTRWADLPDEGKLADLMHEATLAQIDPAKPYVNGDDKAKHTILAGRFNALSQEARQVYTDTRDAYQGHHAKVRSAIKERIERSELKGPRKAELLKQMDDEFFAAVKGVYFPLARFGQYAVTVKGADGKVESVSRAETKAEAEALRNNLLSAFPRDKGFTVGRVMLSKDFIADRDAVGRGFMTELYQVLDKQDMDAAQRAELEDTLGQLYLSSLPDLSWAKHGIHRKGTPGFSQDARRAYAQNMFHGSRYLAKLRYSDLMQDELTAMQKHVDDWREVEDFDQNSAQRVVDEMNKRHESLMNPKSNPLSTALTSFGFVFHLGLSPASAMVNLSQTALVAYPIMGAKWGFGKASAALLKASAEATKGKNDITGSLNADERAAYDEAVRAGTIDVTMAHDLAGIAQGEDAGVMWKIRPVMRWASFLFHHAERFNRQVTFVASYRLAREAGADQKAAFEQATKATYDGHFDYGAANRPRVMQGNVAKVLLLFKQYGQNMVYTLSRNAYQSIKGTDAEKAEARKVLAGLLTSHAMAAGVLGLPMVTTLLAAASMIGGDDDEPWDAQTALQNMLADAFGQKPAEVLARGLSRLTPWDISGRVGLDRLIFPDVQEGLEGQRLAESAMVAALGPVAGIGVNVLKGAQHMGEGRYALGLEAMLPSALRGSVKAIRYANEGVQDKSGISILDEVSPAAVAGQALGFSPSQARNAQEGKSAVMAHDRALGERRQELLTRAARASMAKDAVALDDARKEIARFNEKNPGRRINPNHIMQSVRNRQKRIDQAQDGVYLPKSRRDAMQAGRFAFE